MIGGGLEFVGGLRRAPRPFFVLALLAGAIASAAAQDPVRPWLDWRTVSTPNYRFHYPLQLEEWTRYAAARVESADSAIVGIVGYAPRRPVHVVVDDPFSIPNGYALPFINRPVSVWWALPADPRSDVGNYVTWGEILSVHELTHIAHLTRPSRNPFQRLVWATLPANVGPIARNAPRWVYEGYATLVEGRISGTGRPNNAWRPAILRQWAIEGRLPTYAQLSGWDDYAGGDFAYLGGSAFLEWLVQREGGSDSTLVHVWRRMTARTIRTFDGAFEGVFGNSPPMLYGRFSAQLTYDAMSANAALARAGLVEGELVQRLSWGTGDPALSPNGQRVALAVRERERPARIIVWSTAPEPRDTMAPKRVAELKKRDPEDVPDRPVTPRPKRALRTLVARNGRSFAMPRWLPDSRRMLLTRWAPRADGTLRPDLYVWDTELGGVKRLTHGAGLMHADPHPTLGEALAMQCRAGHCNIAKVDLSRGSVATLLEGNAVRSYYRPRYSPSGARFVVSVSDSGRWRLIVANRDGSDARFVDPHDGANRYDAQWLRHPSRAVSVPEEVGEEVDTLVVVSDRGGVPNLELLSVSDARSRALTRVTGAAVAPDVDPRDGSIWFLSLHSRGFDVRRVALGTPMADSVVDVTARRFGFAGARTPEPVKLVARELPESRPYGSGPRHQVWLPGGYYSADGGGGLLTIFSGDIIGRLNATLSLAGGEPGSMQGGALRGAWRKPRAALEVAALGLVTDPSEGRYPQPSADSIDAHLLQFVTALSRAHQGDSFRWRWRIGGSAGPFEPALGAGDIIRQIAFGEMSLGLQRSRGSQGVVARLNLHGTLGETDSSYGRGLATFSLETVGRDAFPLEMRATYGRIGGSPHPFELFTVGGTTTAISDSSILSQRYDMPVLPTGVARGSTLAAWRIAMPSELWRLFFEGAAAAPSTHGLRTWHRAVGLDVPFAFPPVPPAFTPSVQSRVGVAYSIDQPLKGRVRALLQMTFQP